MDSAKWRMDKFIDQNAQQWFDETVVQTAQKIAWSKGLSEDSISTIYSEKVDYLSYSLIWDLKGPKDVPLAVFLEEGITAHDIEALGKIYGGADSLSWVSKTGKRLFRKKVRHPGTKGMKIIERAWKEGIPLFNKRVKKETENYMRLTKIG